MLGVQKSRTCIKEAECPKLSKMSFKKGNFSKKKKTLLGGWDDSEDTSDDEEGDNDKGIQSFMAFVDGTDDEHNEVQHEFLKMNMMNYTMSFSCFTI